MEAILDSKDLFEDVIVNDEPDFTDNKLEYDIWKKKNREAYSLIILSLSDDLTIIFRGDKRAKRIWYDIKKRFEGSLENKRIDLMLDLARLKLNPNENVNMYIVRAQKLAQEITQLGKTVTERELVRYIVEGLTPNFDTITAALSINREISLPDLRQALLDFEKKRQDRSKNPENAFRSSGNQFKEKSCFICKRKGHFKKDCWFNPDNKGNQKNTTNKNNMASTRNYHKGPKQNKDTARSAIQERTEEPSQRRDSTSEYALHASTREERPTTQDVWIIDSACTSHMTSHGDWIEHKTEERRSIQVAEEGRHIESTSSGLIQATVQGKDKLNNAVTLHNVLHVPHLKGNLMSIPSVVRRGNSVLLNSEGAYIYSSDDKLIGTGNFDGNMYTLNLSRLPEATHVPNEHCLISKDNSRTAWHRRLGHPSDNKLDLILKNNLLKGLNSINGTLDQCDACSLGKMTKVPYVHTDGNQESYPFEAIYVDLCGPMRINSLGGKSKGIKHELTTPYTPRSNGKVERANRTLLDKGRTLLADSQLPLHFWAEAVNTAAYLYNLTPTTNDPDTTPMEKWKGKKPSVSHIMRFGCEVFYKLENHQRHKLEAKSKRGIFVGYSRCRRAYRVFDITARVILETADIHFRENNNVISEEKQNDNNTDTDTYFFIQEDEQLNNHVLSDVDIEEPAPDTMVNRQTESSESDRPQRTRTIPKRFDDYVLATTNETIPKDYEEAIACEDKKHWENAMLEEIQNMYSHQVWELVPRPVNAKVVKSKWMFKISKDQENKTYKARLVAMGYNQIPGRDYNESFSPVIKNATLRTILSMAATKGSVIKLFDVKAAYLNGNIENTIFMEQPAGFVQDRNKVCKLNKSIYGLPQSGRSWYEKSSQVLHDCGLEKLKSDPCLFKWKNEDKYFYVGIYVDDFITVSDSEDTSNRFINKLRHHLEIKDVTCKGMFLGIKIIQDKEGISLQQSHYVQQILQKYGMENCKEVPTPGSKEINLDNHIEDDNCEQHTYQEALGMLMFLAVNTRPDIAYITSKLSQYSRQPKQMHWTAIKRRKTGILKSYADASWSTTHDGKSYGGYVLKLGEATIDWKSSKQPLVALSTMEAEMIAACESCCQIKWIINLLRELEEWNFMEKPTAIYTDSQSLINWISSPKQSSRCRHINRKYHFLRDCYESRDICLLYKPSQDLEADIFTKDLSRDQMKKHLESLSIVGIKPKFRMHLTLMENVTDYESEINLAVKGKTTQAIAKRDMRLITCTSEGQENIRIKDILHVPNLRNNFLFEGLFKRNGIHHQLTATYSPKSNGIAERMNRTLIDTARTFLIDSKLPMKYWAEAIATAFTSRIVLPTESKMKSQKDTPVKPGGGCENDSSQTEPIQERCAKGGRKKGETKNILEERHKARLEEQERKLIKEGVRRSQRIKDRNDPKLIMEIDHYIPDNFKEAIDSGETMNGTKQWKKSSESFSSVHKKESLRTIVAFAMQQNLIIKTYDVKTAYLYGISEVLWLKGLLEELCENVTFPITLKSDSQTAINWIQSDKITSRTKHINRNYYFVNEEIQNGINLAYTKSVDMEADLLTKSLPKDKLRKCADSLGLADYGLHTGERSTNLPCSSAKDMWDKLLSVYEQSSGQRLDMLYNQFFNFKKDPTDDISKHISKLESLWNDMQNELTKQENLKLPESMLMCRIINTLPDEYFDFKSVCESVSKEERSLDNLTQRLRLLEIRIQQRDECSASSLTVLMANSYENKQNMKGKVNKKQDQHKLRERHLMSYGLIKNQQLIIFDNVLFMCLMKREERWVSNLDAELKVVTSRDVIFKETIPTFNLDIEKRNKELSSNQIDEQNDTQDIEKIESNVQTSDVYNLRDRSNISKPQRYVDAEINIAEGLEPKTYKEAMDSPNAQFWKEAMIEEMNSLTENDVYEYTTSPLGLWPIITTLIARLVAKGFAQKKGIDYEETFSPVARHDTKRTLLAIAANEDLKLVQFDIKTAFLYEDLQDQIYIKQPEGFNNGTDLVWKLKKSLYGLKQSPRCWNKKIVNFMKEKYLQESTADPCLFFRKTNDQLLIIAIYVDDGIIAGTNEQEIKKFLDELMFSFKITSEPLNYFLGIEIERQPDGRNIYEYGIMYQKGHKVGVVESFSDADFARDPETRRSTSGVVCKLAGGAISWLSQKQRSVSLSTTEAELVAATNTAKEVIWLNRLLSEISPLKEQPIIKVDNASTIKLIKNPEFHKRTKHIEVRHYFVRKKYQESIFNVEHISGKDQVADIMIKGSLRRVLKC
ncbi:hypothetical protein LAZ67_12001798 [Cordylochernes scorpioides]|uniref:Retrovirus-related Pol polyprotein from transposon TNT 1-94 n=1 Tax=Cordylochernes scorpioides TaxID=51811 RepID=A0ABY6L378_9ARAC|nr:hypothetical protein LAZ67_12001798 [Cordylochernes scorpioides]